MKELALISAWVDDHPENVARDAEARIWGRVAKVGEEFGEVIAAFIGATGQNPRKGVTHDMDDVVKELLDVALTALAAVESLVGNDGSSEVRFREHVQRVLDRSLASTHHDTSDAE